MRVVAWPAHHNIAANPYTSLLYRALRDVGVDAQDMMSPGSLLRRWDVVHLHWPENSLTGRSNTGSGAAISWAMGPSVLPARFRAGILLGLLRLWRRRGAAVVWTRHNYRAHGECDADQQSRLQASLLRLTDAVIYLSNSSAANDPLNVSAYDIPVRIVPHGHYLPVLPDVLPRRPPRPAGAPLRILMFGRMDRYKGASALVAATRMVGSSVVQRLILLGAVSDAEYSEHLNAAADLDHRIEVRARRFSNEELVEASAESDIAVLPYERVVNSGSTLMALSLGLPVVAPDQGSLRDVRDVVGPEWLHLYSGQFTEDVLYRAQSWLEERPHYSRADLSFYDWGPIARRTLDAYQAAITHRLPGTNGVRTSSE